MSHQHCRFWLLWAAGVLATVAMVSGASMTTVAQLISSADSVPSSSTALPQSSHVITPTPTSPTPPPTSTRSTRPTPTPSPFLALTEKCLYIFIQRVEIKFANASYPTINTTTLAKMRVFNHSISGCEDGSNSVVYRRYYGNENDNIFINLIFSQETDDTEEETEWTLSKFQHRRNSEDLFEYNGLQYTIKAPDFSVYTCSKITFSGSDSTGSTSLATSSKSNVTFYDLKVQAFLATPLPSSTSIDCSDEDAVDSQIGLIVGLSVAALMILAVIAIVVAFSIRRWRYHGYNLLDD